VSSGSLPVAWGHVTWFPVTWLPPTASYSLVGSEMYSIRVFSAYIPFQATSVKWRLFQVTSGHLKSRDVISCRMPGSYWELQPCKKWKVHYTWVFRSSTATSRWLQVKWRHFWVISGHLRSRDVISVTWLPPTASNSFIESEIYSVHEFSTFHSHFTVASAEMMSLLGHFRSPEVTWRQFLLRDCLLLRAIAM